LKIGNVAANSSEGSVKFNSEHCITFHKTVKAVPLQAWSGPEGSRKLRFLDFMTTAQDGG